MSRIFVSHSRLDQREAVALKQWLVDKDPTLRDEIFLDVDPVTGILPGVRWREELKRAASRCEAVICLLSANWEASPECRTEFRTAENLNKVIFCARLQPEVGEDFTSEWQYCDLFGGENTMSVDIGKNEPVIFNGDGLRRLMTGIERAGIGVASFPWPPPGQPDRAPYRGWEPFETIDAGVFFGRDAELVLAMDALRGMRQADKTLFVVLGASGAGKSSFLRAGIVPRLQKDDRSYLVLDIVRPELKALTGASGLAQAICATRQRFGLTRPAAGGHQGRLYARRRGQPANLANECRDAATRQLLDTTADGEPLMIVVPLDQAEELFTGDGPEAAGLLALIRDLARGGDGEDGLPLIVAATIRTDRYELMQTAPELAGLQTEQFDLRAMDTTQFENVITGPAQRSTDGGRPLNLDEQLVRRLLADASGGADTLPLLSLTMAWLYRDYGSTRRLTLRPYVERGGIGSVVQTEIDEAACPPTPKSVLSNSDCCVRPSFRGWRASTPSATSRCGAWRGGRPAREAARPLIAVRRPSDCWSRTNATVKSWSKSRWKACCASGRNWRRGSTRTCEALKAADEIERAANWMEDPRP